MFFSVSRILFINFYGLDEVLNFYFFYKRINYSLEGFGEEKIV